MLVSVNVRLLGYKSINVLPMLSYLGYCLFPVCIGSAIVTTIPKNFSLYTPSNVIITFLCSIWGLRAKVRVVTSDKCHADRTALAVLPMCLFYIFIVSLQLNF